MLLNESNAGTDVTAISFGPVGSTTGTNQIIPAETTYSLAGTCTGNPAAGSTINEYKTSLQLPGTHLGIHRAATHLGRVQARWTSSLED